MTLDNVYLYIAVVCCSQCLTGAWDISNLPQNDIWNNKVEDTDTVEVPVSVSTSSLPSPHRSFSNLLC